MAKNSALTWIVKEAKRLKRKYPKRFKKWTQYVSQASAIYANKHKGKSPVGKKRSHKSVRRKVTRKKKANGRIRSNKSVRPRKRRISSINIASVHRSSNVNNIPGSVSGAVGMHHAVDQKALANLNYLVSELDKAQQNWDRLKIMKRKKQLTDPFHRKLATRYPGYIRSLKKQISESKKNIR